MIIILKNIPGTTKAYEIEKFIQPGLKGGLFRRTGHIESIFIQALKDTRFNSVEYHGLIRVIPDPVAKRVIKALNGKQLRGKRIAVNEYHIRIWRNDRRSNSQINKFNERREGDRRRYYLEKIENISLEFSSESGFHRKFN